MTRPDRESSTVEPTNGPLAGVRVLEFGHVAAGPFATLLLADMGADVVKIESPGGDDLRHWPPIITLADGSEFSLNFAALNRNKRSVVLNLKDDSDRVQAQLLAARADVVVENFRPGVMKRLGFDFATLSKINSKLIFCSVSGYGQDGPWHTQGAFDVVIQAESGLMDVTGEEDGAPVKCGVPIADFVAGHYAAYSIVCALLARNHKPGPVYLDCSMLESVIAISALQTSEYWGTGISPRRLGSAHPRNAPYQAFNASDQSFVVAAGNDRLWQQLCDVIGNPALANDSRFVDQHSRVRNVAELTEILSEYFQQKPAAYWIENFQERGIPCALVNTVAQALENPQLSHRKFVRHIELPDGSITPATVFPVAMSGANYFSLRPPPLLGQHTREVEQDWRQPSDFDGARPRHRSPSHQAQPEERRYGDTIST